MSDRRQQWKIALSLAALVTVSAGTGAVLGHRIARQQIDARNDPENWNDYVSREFERLIRPSPEQRPKVKSHLDNAVRQLQAIRIETVQRSTNVIWRLVADVERELTPEQRKAFEALKPQPSDLNLDVLNVTPADAPEP